MTQYASAIDFMKLWEQSDQTSERKLKKILSDKLDTIGQKHGDILSMIKKGPAIDGPVFRYMEEYAYPTKITAQLATTTLTISGEIFKAAATEDAANQIIRVGTILERPTDGVQAKVTDVAGLSTLTCTVEAYGNTSLSNDSGAVEWDIISEPWAEFRDADMTRSLDRSFREVGWQIHQETLEIGDIRRATSYEVVPDEFAHQVAQLMEKLYRQEEISCLRSRPYYSSGFKFADATQTPTMCGILTWPVICNAEYALTNTYLNKSGAELTKPMLDDLIRNLWLDEYANYNEGNWQIITDPITHGYISDFDVNFRRKASEKEIGWQVDSFDSKIGKTFPIKSSDKMRAGTLILANFDTFSRGPHKDFPPVQRKLLATQGLYSRWMLSYITYGVVARKPRQIGMIYNLITTAAS